MQDETLDELFARGIRNDIRVGDYIVSRDFGMACGFVAGEGILNKQEYWIYTDARGKKDAMPKSEAFMPGFYICGEV